MAFNIGPTISVKGEKEYQKAMADIRQNMKYVTAEMAKTTSEFGKNDKSVQALTSKNQVLQKVLDQQKKAVEETRAVMKRLTEQGVVPTAKEYRDLEANLNYAEAAFNATQQEIRENLDTMEAGRADVQRFSEQMREVGKEGQDAGRGLESAFSDIGRAIGGPAGTVISKIGSMTKAIGGAATSTSAAGSTMGAALGGVIPAALAVVGALAKIGAEAYAQARKVREAAVEMKIALGLTKTESEALTDTGKRLYAEGYAQSFDDAMHSLLVVKSYMNDLDDATLENITRQVSTLSKTFNADSNAVVKAADVLMSEYGISAQKAMNIIVRTLQSNPIEAGELLDTIREYGVQFEQMGYSAEQFASVLVTSMDNGVWSVDKVADAFKELGIRAKDGSDTTRQALADLFKVAIGESKGATESNEKFIDRLMTNLAEGGHKAKSTADQIITNLSRMTDPMKQNEIGVALMGSQWEDVGTKAITSLAGMKNVLGDVGGLASGSADEIAALVPAFEKTRRSIEGTYGSFAAGVATPAIEGAKVTGEMSILNAQAQQEATDKVFDQISKAWEDTIGWLKGLFTPETEDTGETIGGAMIDGAIKGIADGERDLLDQIRLSFSRAAETARNELSQAGNVTTQAIASTARSNQNNSIVRHEGSIRIEGVNDRGEFVDAAQAIVDRMTWEARM